MSKLKETLSPLVIAIAKEASKLRRRQFKVLAKGTWTSTILMSDEKNAIVTINHIPLETEGRMIIYTLTRSNANNSPSPLSESASHYVYHVTQNNFMIHYSKVNLTGNNDHTRIDWMIVKH